MENLEKLKRPFPASDIEWRIQQSGITNGNPWAICLAYINARAVMDRLDEVVGAGNWHDDYEFHDQGVVCRLTIHGVTKVDGAQFTQVESFKGGISDALKRAAVKWGIGRYLYNLPSGFARCSFDKITGWRKGYAYEDPKNKRGGKVIWWMPPELPDEFLP